MRHKIILSIIFIWLGWHLAQPIDFAANDLGRHLKNGELILKGVWDVLYVNYYSLLLPNYPFINHHWFFGVLAFLVWSCVGFAGLSVAYVALQLLTFKVFLSRIRPPTSFALLCALSLLAIPLLSSRADIRPEGISMLLAGIYWALLGMHQQKRIQWLHLKIILVVLQIIWVNTHIFFTMGLALMMVFWIHARINAQAQEARQYAHLYLLLLAASLINPSGVQGFLLAFHIGQGLGYSILEEQSVFFMLPRYPTHHIYSYFLVTMAFSWIGYGLLIKKEGFKKHAAMMILMLLVSCVAMRVVRFIGPYGYFWVPLSMYAWCRIIQSWPGVFKKTFLGCLVLLGVIVSVSINFDIKKLPVFGLTPNVNEAADFFKREKLKGPIFNNYEIGGYLIYHLQGQAPVFVDNRVEAFPKDFFRKLFIPMQVKEEFWQHMQDQFGFNAIFFNRDDQTPWSRKFILQRLQDPHWAAVFVDENLIILVRRIPENEKLISRYEFKLSKIKP